MIQPAFPQKDAIHPCSTIPVYDPNTSDLITDSPDQFMIVSVFELGKRRNHDLLGLMAPPHDSPMQYKDAVVIIDRSDREYRPNGLFAVRMGSLGIGIRRVGILKNGYGFKLWSDEPDEPTEVIYADWDDIAIGKAVYLWTDLSRKILIHFNKPQQKHSGEG